MTWGARFLAVRATALRIDEPVALSDKATPEQLSGYVRTVPEVYRHLSEGVTGEELLQWRQRNDALSQVGETYYHLFEPAGRDGRIEAELTGGQLLVTRGRHRVEAARQEGVEVLPVHVRAELDALGAVASSLEADVATHHPAAVKIHRGLHERHYAEPDRNRGQRHTNLPREGEIIMSDRNPTRPSPEFEPRPPSTSPTVDRDRVARELGQRATAQASRDAQQTRVQRAMGQTATGAAQRSSQRSRDRG